VAGLAGVGLAVAACFAGSVLVDAPPPAVSGSSVLLVEDTSLGTVDGHHTRRAEIRQVHSVACEPETPRPASERAVRGAREQPIVGDEAAAGPPSLPHPPPSLLA
jgi:hypothetical protein